MEYLFINLKEERERKKERKCGIKRKFLDVDYIYDIDYYTPTI